ncbi:MAG: metallophosphoesterase, partial [Candidatus Micrarchaeota archaeon]|nr:metallophosphoesterase [Candidatus Micrarchaeota archaeon]
ALEARRIKFAYGEPALVADAGGEGHLVVGDLHIGMERELQAKGIHVSRMAERMSKRILGIAAEFEVKRLIIIGDVKHSILYPERYESREIASFFDALRGLEVIVVPGNHDAHLREIADCEVREELVLGGVAFAHGNRNPTEAEMMADYLVTAHSHACVRMRDSVGAFYEQKVWLVSELNRRKAAASYGDYSKRLKLVMMPAFNDLIMGTAVTRGLKNTISPMLRSGLFSSRKTDVYNLLGEAIDLKLLRLT